MDGGLAFKGQNMRELPFKNIVKTNFKGIAAKEWLMICSLREGLVLGRIGEAKSDGGGFAKGENT